MCGRIALTNPKEENLKKRFNLTKISVDLKPRFNISPSQQVPVILNESPEELTNARWGLIPHWAKDEETGYKMINARAETIAEKPSYRNSIKKKRCLIIADSFYEWQRSGSKKDPYRILMNDEAPFALAGIWNNWEREDREIKSCSIITTSANSLMQKIHDRMPVILPREKESLWLSDLGLEEVFKMLTPYDAKAMRAYEISALVNSPMNDSEEVIRPLESHKKAGL